MVYEGGAVASRTIYVLEESNITISGGAQLSGVSQGDGSHFYDPVNPITITLDNTDWLAVNITEADGDTNFDDSDNSQTLDGDQFLDGDLFTNGNRVEAEYRLTVEDPSGVEYTLLGFNINEPGVTSYATVEGLAFVDTGMGFPPANVPLTVTGAFEGPSVPYTDLAEPACLTPGSRVCTPRGLVDVANLKAGDQIPTMDHGLRTIAWVGQTRLPPSVLETQPKYRPVLIRQGALGDGLPLSDMHVSPQHRILVSGWQAELLFGEEEVLVPAIKLCNGTSITQDATTDGITYIHVMFHDHEIIWVDGVATESYLAAAHDRSPIAAELRGLFPELFQANRPMRVARPCVSDRRAAALAA